MKGVEFSYQLSAETVLKNLGTTKAGLSTATATSRTAQYGSNKLVKKRGVHPIFTFLAQFKDLMIVLLLVSAVISFYLDDVRTGGILIFIVFVNSIIGFSQEYKAEKIMESLEKLIVAEAKVFRNGQLTTLPAQELTLGDVIYVEEGDSAPADGRIIEESELGSNDFALTGESNPVRKFTHSIVGEALIGNQRNMIFMGTTIATGNAICVVTATGMHTELGRIAGLSQVTKAGLSPLQREMNNLAVRITIATLVLAGFLLAISLGTHLGIKDAFLFAIGIASAMIPQGLPAEVTVALSRAASTLAKDNTLIKKLSAVESLGATSIICTDKTGTLTKNEMTVEHILLPGVNLSVSGTGYEANGRVHDAHGQELSHAELEKLFLFFGCGFFASNARIVAPDDAHATWHCIGDPTEGALVTLARKAGLNTDTLVSEYPELREFPFDSVRKRMSSIRTVNNHLHVFTKGAPESVISCATHIKKLDGSVKTLTAADKKLLLAENDVYAKRAMRNLAFAYRVLPDHTDINKLDIASTEQQLVYMGMVSIIDPVRDEVAAAMEAARKAHIKVSIITGDYAPTAKAIAVRAKLADNPEDIILVPGEELPTMSDAKLIQLVERGSTIFSRVSPEDKLRIVSLVKKTGHVIAVTGDGINDAPALKAADIGVAMGVTGTDVAKQSADIVLLDDSFHTLVGAISQGRIIFQNIRNATLSALDNNIAELVVILLSLIVTITLRIPPAISVIQILAIDLIAELLPIAALAWDKPAKSMMTNYPRDPNSHILSLRTSIGILNAGLLVGGLSFVNYILYIHQHGGISSFTAQNALYPTATTLTFASITFSSFASIFVLREAGWISSYAWSNKRLLYAMLISTIFVLNMSYNPLLQHIFNTGPLALYDWGRVGACVVMVYLTREIAEQLFFSKRRKTVKA